MRKLRGENAPVYNHFNFLIMSKKYEKPSKCSFQVTNRYVSQLKEGHKSHPLVKECSAKVSNMIPMESDAFVIVYSG